MALLWLDTLLEASFKDVAFHVDSIEIQAGDNIVLREYPFQDLPTVFSMGEAAEEIKVSAYVIGPDYQTQRDALRQALTGEGVLVHPTAGVLRVYVNGKYSMREAPTSEGTVVRFDVTFVRAEPRRYPVAYPSTQTSAAQAGDDAKAAAGDRFAANFDFKGAPGWVQNRVISRAQAALSDAWSGLRAATAGLDDFTDSAIASYQTLRDGLTGLMATPRAFAGALSELFALPTELSAASSTLFQQAFEGLFDLRSTIPNRAFEVAVVPPVGGGLVMLGLGDGDALASDTTAQAQLAALQGELDRLHEALATAAWVQAVAATELAGYDDAMRKRRAVYDQVTGLMARASAAAAPSGLPASSWHDAMAALLAASLADLQDRSRDLARLTSYTPSGWTSVWVISYRLYGTPDYADEIQTLNRHVTNPLLVPPGRALRVARH